MGFIAGLGIRIRDVSLTPSRIQMPLCPACSGATTLASLYDTYINFSKTVHMRQWELTVDQ